MIVLRIFNVWLGSQYVSNPHFIRLPFLTQNSRPHSPLPSLTRCWGRLHPGWTSRDTGRCGRTPCSRIWHRTNNDVESYMLYDQIMSGDLKSSVPFFLYSTKRISSFLDIFYNVSMKKPKLEILESTSIRNQTV